MNNMKAPTMCTAENPAEAQAMLACLIEQRLCDYGDIIELQDGSAILVPRTVKPAQPGTPECMTCQ
jgi:hypothetical protein